MKKLRTLWRTTLKRYIKKEVEQSTLRKMAIINSIITNADGEIVTAVGGNTKSLKTWKDVTKMLNNNGGYSTLPY